MLTVAWATPPRMGDPAAVCGALGTRGRVGGMERGGWRLLSLRGTGGVKCGAHMFSRTDPGHLCT